MMRLAHPQSDDPPATYERSSLGVAPAIILVNCSRATVWSYVVPHPPLLAPYSDLAPYNVIVVSLDEDPNLRFVGNLVSGVEGALNEIDLARVSISCRLPG